MDPENGWLSWMVVAPTGEIKLQRTFDGGRNWHDVHLEIYDWPEWVDSSFSYALADDTFRASEDGGKTWRETRVPGLRFGTADFFSRNVGWIACATGNDLVVFRTTDSGRTWTESRFGAGEPTSRIKSLFFLDATHGWLVREYGRDERGRAGSHVFSTSDGGATWVAEPDLSFQGEGRYLGPVRFLSPKTGFLFGSIESGQKLRSALFYTTDGGGHWRSVPLPRLVDACQVFDRELRCTTGFSILTIHPK